jgi:N-acetyl-anhydromuramyl-L-alanine amidase AmpD
MKPKDDTWNVIFPESTKHKSRRLFIWKPRVVLVHATVSSGVRGTLHWFLNPKSKVSSDFVIDKNGEIYRPVPRGFYSWHAGTCTYENKERRDYNRISYGVELVNLNDGEDPYPPSQLRALAFVVATIQAEAPTVTRIRRHADVAVPKGRKSDPRGLELGEIYAAVKRWQPQVALE